MSVYYGYVYEIDATVDLKIKVGSGTLDFVDVTWSGDWETIPYITKIGESKTSLELRLSKMLTPADSFSEIISSVKAVAVDRFWSPMEYSAEDSGKVGWEIAEEVLPMNNPDICIQQVATVLEGDPGEITKGQIEVCLSEPAMGRPLTVDYATRNGTATGGIGVRNIAYDEFGNPYVSVTESAKQNIRIVYDGGFPKYYSSWMDANSKQFLKNCVEFCHHNTSRPRRILLVGDHRSDGQYDVKVPTDTGFWTSFTNMASEIGYEIDILYPADISGGNPTQADFAKYGVAFFMSVLSEPTVSDVFVQSFEEAVRSGMGLIVITDHYDFHGSANKICARFNSEFYGLVDRSPMPISELKAKYGDHVLWSNMSGDFYAGGSEGNIRNKAEGDYLGTDGTLTFEVGEQCKKIDYEIFGNNEITGNKMFYMDLSNNSHGNITCETGTIVIEDDDILPCGESASAGGDGVAYFKITTGSVPLVVTVLWRAYGKHDRWDWFKNGGWIGSSQQDLDHYFDDPRAQYDRDAYNALSGGEDGKAFTQIRQHCRNRAGCGAMFGAFYPLITDDPFYIDLRSEGPDGTGWDFGTMCFPARDITNAKDMEINNQIIQRIDHIEIFDCNTDTFGGSDKRFRFDFTNLNVDKFGEGNQTTYARYTNDKSQTLGFKAVPCKLVFLRNGSTVHETGWIAAGTSASAEIDYVHAQDFRYLEMRVYYQTEAFGSEYMIQTDYQGTNQAMPPRVQWEMKINRI